MKNTSRMFTDHKLSEDYNYGSWPEPRTAEEHAKIISDLLKIKIPEDIVNREPITVEKLIFKGI